jgi:AraC-like DNA-binding protein
MHSKDRQSSSFDATVANGKAAHWLSETPKNTPLPDAASSWPKKVFTTSDPDELVDHFNTKASVTVDRIVPLDSKVPFAFTRAEIDFGRIRLTQGKSTAFHMVGHSTCLTLNISEAGSCVVKGLGKTRAMEIGSHCGDNAVVGGWIDKSGVFETSPDGMRFVIRLDEQHVTDQLAVVDGLKERIPEGAICLDLSTPLGVNFHRAVNFIWQQRTPPSALLRAAFDEILLQGVVSLFTPVVSDGMARAPDPGPAHLKRACELIRANVAEPVRIAEIASELGISPRHLEAGFRQHLGTTPQRFLRDCRLDEANRRLTTAKPGITTTTIAYDCGFGHLGEFAQSYRLRFGESPSETLRRSVGRA